MNLIVTYFTGRRKSWRNFASVAASQEIPAKRDPDTKVVAMLERIPGIAIGRHQRVILQ